MSRMRARLATVGAAVVMIGTLSMVAHGEDRFTPLTALALTPGTTPVLGTDGKLHAVYELELANTREVPATLHRIKVVEGTEAGRVLAEFGEEDFATRLRQLHNVPAENATLKLGESRVFLVDVTLTPGKDVPPRIVHLLNLTGAGIGPAFGEAVKQTYGAAPVQLGRKPAVLQPPLAGKGWVAFNGCCGALGVHRATGLPVNGRRHYAQRFAIDWVRLDAAGRIYSGKVGDLDNHTAYGAEVLAVAAGTVVSAQDGLPEQRPPNLPPVRTINLRNIDGNHVVVDIGEGRFAFYAHLQPGSVTVRRGQKVRSGQVLGLLGNSGNSSAPHLHFHLMDGASVLGSEGLPFVHDRFGLAGNIPDAAIPDNLAGDFRRFLRRTPARRVQQLPLDLDVIDFRG